MQQDFYEKRCERDQPSLCFGEYEDCCSYKLRLTHDIMDGKLTEEDFDGNGRVRISVKL